eukprot:GILJ01010472.1.p1 GENE.GILJ01010472.1~~GILJ01010472.1.p1  ORF type:complete len:441 (+),score=72.32 GILJ01010472.1:31-1353(+)
MVLITSLEALDIRFPTSDHHDGSDSMHPDPDYSCAYVILHTDDPVLKGHGLTFTIGRGNEIVTKACEALKHHVVGKTLESITEDFGAAWKAMVSDGQLRWLGPEKGVIHMATGAVVNAIWDLWAKKEGKPLWLLLAEMPAEQLVRCVSFHWITDAITPEEAVAILKTNEPEKAARIAKLKESGYPAYTTSAGWLGYSDDKIRRLCREGMEQGWTHFKVKVGVDVEDDIRRLKIIREEVGFERTVMVDANQRWDVPVAIEYMQQLAFAKPWFIEEPTCPDDILGHAAIRKAMAPLGIKVATGEVCANRVLFKQLMQASAIDICQIDSCRVAGVNEIIAILLMAAKFNIPVCPHAGGVGLCEYVQHLSMFDFVAVSGRVNIIEFVDHLHEHFLQPCEIKNASYMPPYLPGYSIEMKAESLQTFVFPHGEIWAERIRVGKATL